MDEIPPPYGNERTRKNPPTDTTVMRHYPYINWVEPLLISNLKAAPIKAFACRLCIARFGLYGINTANLPKNLEEHRAHLKQYHPAVLQ